jgi:hypothetical protein
LINSVDPAESIGSELWGTGSSREGLRGDDQYLAIAPSQNSHDATVDTRRSGEKAEKEGQKVGTQ